MKAPDCPYCHAQAVLVTGDVIYPHREDLRHLKFWRCAPCDAYCGTHRAGAYVRIGGRKVVSDGTLPLGRLANAELRRARNRAHAAFDPLWKSRQMSRREAYTWLAGELGISFENCHIALFDVDGCEAVVAAVQGMARRAA